jgi:predicted RNase H-like nuclease
MSDLLEESLEMNKKIRKIKNQWRKDKAILEQEKDLLNQTVQDLKEKEVCLKKSNMDLIKELDNYTEETHKRTKSYMEKMIRENGLLQERVEKYMRVSRQIEQEKSKLIKENEIIGEKAQDSEAEKIALNNLYQDKLNSLNVDFERLKEKNEKLLNSFHED